MRVLFKRLEYKDFAYIGTVIGSPPTLPRAFPVETKGWGARPNSYLSDSTGRHSFVSAPSATAMTVPTTTIFATIISTTIIPTIMVLATTSHPTPVIRLLFPVTPFRSPRPVRRLETEVSTVHSTGHRDSGPDPNVCQSRSGRVSVPVRTCVGRPACVEQGYSLDSETSRQWTTTRTAGSTT